MDNAFRAQYRKVAVIFAGIRAPAVPSPRQPCYATAMGDEGVIELIGRIDGALARIEAAAERRPAAPNVHDDGRRAAIEEAHQALRAKVERTISQIDRLIAAGEQG